MISGVGACVFGAISFVLAADDSATAAGAYETVVTAPTVSVEELDDERATSTVSRKELERRLPRSTPDALRYEPGVFIQQSGHGQGSAFIRGLTGQQTLILFDGIRVNNSTFRQGPNQYLFTLDPYTVRSIEVQRGGGSTRWGSDALGGVIDARPIEPTWIETGARIEPRLFARGTTADSERGGRVQADASGKTPWGKTVGFVGGLGGRRVGLLHGPPVLNPNPNTDAGALPWVPAYEGYNPLLESYSEQPKLRTQLGTGFDELTADGRLVLRLSANEELTFAGYLYREYDAPRTDQCPPPTGRYDECLTYEEQFRHLTYGAWERRNFAGIARARLTVSWQQQHEKRRLDLTSGNLVGYGLDDVNTLGIAAHANLQPWELSAEASLQLSVGADSYLDWLGSTATQTYTDTGDVRRASRGQYLDGSRYLYGGAYVDLVADLGSIWRGTFGVRPAWSLAEASGDPESGTQAIHRRWFPVVGHAGIAAQVNPPLAVLFNYDNSFRAPNLDDLTSRQQTGPGFQFENPNLRPERAHTFELGGRWRSRWLVADLWLFETLLQDNIVKVVDNDAVCPVETQQCSSATSKITLVNAPSTSEIRGVEGAVKLIFPGRVSLRATLAYARSEGPRVGDAVVGGEAATLGSRVPLSRTPPVNGTAELQWTHKSGISVGSALQWARTQKRLAAVDNADGRIPKYGTPGFAVVHLRGSYRLGPELMIAVVLENLFDSPYRFHGSSVNGAGRGLIVQLQAAHAFVSRDETQGGEF